MRRPHIPLVQGGWLRKWVEPARGLVSGAVLGWGPSFPRGPLLGAALTADVGPASLPRGWAPVHTVALLHWG